MSICVNTYDSYSSYLKNKGLEQRFCILSNMIDNSDLTNGGTINGDLTITGTLTVGTSTTVITTNSLNVDDKFIIDTNRCVFNTDLSINNFVFINNDLNVSGSVGISGDLTIDGSLNAGYIDLGASLSIQNLTIDNSLNLNGTFESQSFKIDSSDNIIIECSNVSFNNNTEIYKNKGNIRQSNIFPETFSIILLEDFSLNSVGSSDPSSILCSVSNDYIEYSNSLNPENIFTYSSSVNNRFIVDVSSNQEYFRDCIVEIYLNCKVETTGADIDYTLFSFRSEQQDLITGYTEFVIDKRSFGKRDTPSNVTYGPYAFLTTSDYYSILQKKYNVMFEAKTINSTANISITNPKLIFKQRFI